MTKHTGPLNQIERQLSKLESTATDEPWKVEDRGEKPAIALKGR